MSKGKRASVNNGRPTIGFLIDNVWGEGEYQSVLWRGVSAAAQEQDANLICFVGGTLGSSPFNEFEIQRNATYDLVTEDNVDALILSSGTLFNFVTQDEVKRFHTRYQSLPMVSIGIALEGIVSVLLENEPGLRRALVHLIEDHGYHRIAFVRGPEVSDDAEERYRTYREVLAEHGLPLDPDLVAPGDFSTAAGRRAVSTFFDERKVNPEAIVGANDATAFGIIDALQKRDVLVPYDVAVVGFDDTEFAALSVPSLTTVRHPTYEQGKRAVEVLLALLAGETVPERVKLPTESVVRQSCGCLYQPPEEAEAAAVRGGTLKVVFTAQRDAILSEMVEAVQASRAGQERVAGWSTQLLDAFLADLQGEKTGNSFLHELEKVLYQAAVHGDNVYPWHDVMSILRRYAAPVLAKEALAHAAALWQQAGALIGRMERQVQGRLRQQAEQRLETLRNVSQALIVAFDMSDLMNIVARQLRRMGSERGYVVLYENPESSIEWGRLILGYDERGRIELEEGGRRFPTCQLVPRDLLSQEKRHHLLIETLYFRDERLGYILVEVGSPDGLPYVTMREPIGSALKGALLLKQVEHRALQLQTAAEVSRAATSVLDLDALLQQVVDLVQKRFDLYYVGLFLIEGPGSPEGADAPDGASATCRPAGRQAPNGPPGPLGWAVLRAASGEVGRQMLEQGHRLAAGGDSMVGQCIADHQPRVALDVTSASSVEPGKETVRFSNPLLPETHSEMALPLVTREGAIGALNVQSRERGAFGEAEVAVFETLAGQLANAIANARAYAQVARAYDEIQRLNERLKDENLRMAAELEVTRRLQQMLLPTDEELARIEGLDIAGWMEPAEEVGGDYYDVLQHNGSVKIGIGDVTGHGLESGVVMLMLQTAVRTLLTEGEEDPVRFLEVLNQLLRDNIRRMQVSKSMTLSLLDYELGRMRLSGQHEYVIVVRAGGKVELQDTLDLGFPLGIEHGIAQWVDKMDIVLAPGDGVVLYSDGITEAEDEGGEFYGLKRLCEVVSTSWEGSAEEVKNAVVVDVKTFIGTQTVYDDLTLVVMKQL